MNRNRPHALLITLVVLCGASLVHAEGGPRILRNWTFEAAIGGGASNIDGLGSMSGMSGRLGFTQQLCDHWGVVFAMSGALREGERSDSSHVDTFLINRSVSLRWYPVGTRMGPGVLHVDAGIGRASAEVEETIEPTRRVEVKDDGIGYVVGVGYALRFGTEVSLGLEMEMDWLRDLARDSDFLASHFVVEWHL